MSRQHSPDPTGQSARDFGFEFRVLRAAFADFFVPVTLGNIVGGVRLVAILNYSQTAERRFPGRDPSQLRLSWAEWIYSRSTGQPRATPSSDESFDESTVESR